MNRRTMLQRLMALPFIGVLLSRKAEAKVTSLYEKPEWMKEPPMGPVTLYKKLSVEDVDKMLEGLHLYPVQRMAVKNRLLEKGLMDFGAIGVQAKWRVL